MMISVIVPVYNTSAYVEECVRSILNQSYTNLELILVDDGSGDNSLEVCKRMAYDDERIRVFHQENKGVTAARRLGVEHSRGEFICFVDSDDVIEKEALSFLISKMNADVDIVTTWDSAERIISGGEYVNRLLQKTTNLALWGKLYRKHLVITSKALEFRREIYIGEDQLGNIRMALHARNVFCTSAAIYKYRDNPQSVWRKRRWSLAYEEMFRDEIETELGDRIGEFDEAWYKFQLYVLYDLIRHKVKFSYKRDWIANLLKKECSYDLTIREKIVRAIRCRYLCRCLLKFGCELKYKINSFKWIL